MGISIFQPPIRGDKTLTYKPRRRGKVEVIKDILVNMKKEKWITKKWIAEHANLNTKNLNRFLKFLVDSKFIRTIDANSYRTSRSNYCITNPGRQCANLLLEVFDTLDGIELI